MSALPVLKYITEEEYLEAEEKSLTKNEYYQGEIFPMDRGANPGEIDAMSGAFINHNRLVRNALSAIDNHLLNKNCEIFPSHLRIQVEANSLFTYPDLSIVCDKPEFYKKRKDTVKNPTVLIEVLSPSTEKYDRNAKFKLYQDLLSLKEYILISSTIMLVEKFTKQANGDWLPATYKKPTDQLEIESIGFTIKVESLYRKVDFDEE